MITGLEYVLMAYGIWLFAVVIYIFLNKKRIKTLNSIISKFEERKSVSIDDSMILGKDESKK
tara:strand:+ start:647 stop:832 length:186 start_codon:yes stop_codon:yes gene_type:complete